MPDGFVVTGADLQKASLDTAQVRENSLGNINSLKSQLGGLEGAWRGEAATAFHQLFERFNTASDKVLADLQTISESLATAAKQYGVQEESTTSTFKQGGNFEF
jgi:WXG100 family type VII secretion target